ncbi:MAG: DUF4405 domain-containing protein [Ignavibacteriales bacterium]|nr:MAG: DUF4405 domain-containing protein [Ignavibacteriales bacterium]
MMFNKVKQTLPALIRKIFYVDTYGSIAVSSFIICVISGVLLAIPFDVKNPYDSIAYIQLTNSSAAFVRSLHYWSAQLFLIFTALHIWDHFSKATEKKVKSGIWFRLTISILITFFVMLSGFILKADADSLQARRIISSLIEEIPWLGKSVAYFLFGAEGNFQIIYIHHIATATIILAVVIYEHSKIIWGKLKTFLITLIAVCIPGYFFIPSLNDNLNPIVKGPWYFLGLQEILSWLNQSLVVLLLLLILFLLFLIFLLPRLNDKAAGFVKKGILSAFIIYLILTLFAYFFRGENWKFTLPWKNSEFVNSGITPINFFSDLSPEELAGKDIPKILGRYEGCLNCHGNVKGFSASHDPKAIGCASCHLGNPFTLDKNNAHKGMILIPGNLETASLTCGNTNCHPQMIERVNNSLMTTMSGIISVNKFVFDESDSTDGLFNVKDIKHSAAESHLRNLCASCHLGNEKIEYGPVNELSRGGGCLACHLNYNKEAIEELESLKFKKSESSKVTKFHPDVSLKITNDHCFGCHSRSGRISLNYEGWHETQLSPEEVKNKPGYRTLMDGRVFQFVEADVHHQNGMDCIDCHNSYELMGDGNLYNHKEEQIKIECIDCHRVDKPLTVSLNELDYESKKIADLRKYDNRKFLVGKNSGLPVINSYLNEKEIPELVTKNSGFVLPLKSPRFVCVEGKAHKRLSCNTCHTSWAPQCIGCHTDYNPNSLSYDLLSNKEIKGEWNEHAGKFLAEPPALGIRIKHLPGKNKTEIIDNFMPGMIISLDKNNFGAGKTKLIFKRLYAPSFSHTIVKRSRSCESCHNNPLALGYGRGKLIYEKEGKFGKWKFYPEYPLSKYDGLPDDAWTGFLQEGKTGSSTRTGARPFTIEEQKKILTIGACLNCHTSESYLIKRHLTDWQNAFKRISAKCLLPKWN